MLWLIKVKTITPLFPLPEEKVKKEEEVKEVHTHTWAVHGIYWSGSKQEGDC